MITKLDQNTINQIAAGEVIERPSSVVKELLENSIDAGATAVTVEIRDGGISLIRITDNGCGIEENEIPLAFLRHTTSKIRSVEDLLTVKSLGFRGEALSSIAAVAQVEMITRTASSLMGFRYMIEGGVEKQLEETGSPEGTTILVRNLFYHTPARKKYLKSAATEGAYINDLMQRMALSRPDISFRLIISDQTRFHTAGNHSLKDIIYGIYGRDITRELVPVSRELFCGTLEGYVGKPSVSRGNRSWENYFINGRYIRSNLIGKALEEAFHGMMMQHKYPFCVLHLKIDPAYIDVNVHPSKMEIRFQQGERLYQEIVTAVISALKEQEMIPSFSVGTEEKEAVPVPESWSRWPEPFEKQRIRETPVYPLEHTPVAAGAKQQEIFEEKLLQKQSLDEYQIIGQLFRTYWLVQYQDNFLIIDQHAAHEKVLFEKLFREFYDRAVVSQQVDPPFILTLSPAEELLIQEYGEYLKHAGFELEPFGGPEYAIYAVPMELCRVDSQVLLKEILDGLSQMRGGKQAQTVYEQIASCSCKSAVKGNQQISRKEMEALLEQLLELENPYSCPHGRPVMIRMTRYELEKKFKRVVS